MHLRIVTRKSKLALAQTEIVKNLLLTQEPQLNIDILPISTEGDRVLDQSLVKIGGKGLFIKELEYCLLNSTADLAVHSVKDMPARLPDGLSLGAVLPRADPRDVFVSYDYAALEDMPMGAIIGTSSLRRQAQILTRRPDLKIKMLRGNVVTRIDKLLSGEYAAIVLAAAGLERLHMHQWLDQPFAIEEMLPAVGQGALGIEYLSVNSKLVKILQKLHDRETAQCIGAERAMNAILGGSCQAPIGGYAAIESNRLNMYGMVASPDGSKVLKAYISGEPEEYQAIGNEVATLLMEQGAADIIVAAKKMWE